MALTPCDQLQGRLTFFKLHFRDAKRKDLEGRKAAVIISSSRGQTRTVVTNRMEAANKEKRQQKTSRGV